MACGAAALAALILACVLAPLADGSHDRLEAASGGRSRAEGHVMRLLGGGKPGKKHFSRGDEQGALGRPPGSPAARASNPSAEADSKEGGRLDEADRARGIRWLADLVAAEKKSGWAIYLYNKTAGMPGGDASSLCTLSRILEVRGDIGQARSVAARALQMDPTSVEAKKLHASLLMMQGPGGREMNEADALLRSVLELDPADVEAACLQGRGLIARGQDKAASETCQAALQRVKDPKAYTQGLHAYANLMRDAGRFSEAQREYVRLLGVAAPGAALLCDYALLRERMGGTHAAGQSAVELYQHALSACPMHPGALVNYANLVLREGGNGSTSTEEARDMLRAAVQGSPDSIPAWMGLATHLLADGQAEAAEEITRESASKFDASFAVLSRHAYVLHCAGRLDEAEAAYRAALEASPANVDTIFNLATLQHAQATSSKGGVLRGDAERLYRRTLELDPKHAEAALNLGVLLHMDSNPEADRWLSRACGLIPKHIPTLTTYAGVLAEGGALGRSMQQYRRAMALDPNDKQLLLRFARFLDRRQKNVAEASELYQRVIEMDPSDAQTMVECASMLHDVGNGTSEARAIYESALAVNPTSSAVLFGIGHVAETDGNLNEAEVFYHKAVIADPGHVSAWNNYGRLLEVNKGDFRGAEKAYEKALRMNPKHSLALFNYGSMLQTQRRFDRAEECYKRFLRFCVPHKVHGSVLCNYGLLLEESRQYNQAEQKYKQAMLLDPQDCFTLVNYASLLHEVRGDTKAAARHYEKALSLNPGETTAMCAFGRMMHQLGQNQRAEELFQSALIRDPAHVPTLVSYATLLRAQFKDLDKARGLLDMAQRLNPPVAQDYLVV